MSDPRPTVEHMIDSLLRADAPPARADEDGRIDHDPLDAIVTSLAAARRGVAALQAMEVHLLHAANTIALERVDASTGDGDLPLRAVAAEIAAALRVSDRTVQRQLDHASMLVLRFPATHDALTAGRIARAHVQVIVDAGARIDDAGVRARYESVVLEVAERESASRLKGFARLAAERLLPRGIDERHVDAVEDRGVIVDDLEDGVSELRLRAPSTLVHGIHDRLTRAALAVRDGDATETRSVEQLRADLLCDLALTGAPAAHGVAEILGAVRAEVCVTVPVMTLAGATGAPALLDGTQPVDVVTALQLVGGATGWDRVLTDPITESVLAVDRYRPSAELRRFLRAVDVRCRFPGCMIPARNSDLDHVHDAARGGPTEAANLTSLCRRHHVLKHHSPVAPGEGPRRHHHTDESDRTKVPRPDPSARRVPSGRPWTEHQWTGDRRPADVGPRVLGPTAVLMLPPSSDPHHDSTRSLSDCVHKGIRCPP